MSWVQLAVLCTGCSTSNQLNKLRKPTRATPVITKFKCTGCESRFLVRIVKANEAGRVGVDMVPLDISPKLVELLRAKIEAAKEKAEPDAQTDNT